jgi:hypothetical protein
LRRGAADFQRVLKKLGGALLVFAVAAVGMTASTALALRMVRPAEPPDLYRPGKSAAADERKAHPWDEPCATANTEVTALEALAGYVDPQTFEQYAREAISINVRLLVTLREKNVKGRAAQRFLVRLERGISDDRAGIRRIWNPAAVERWIAASEEGNATLASLAKKLGTPQCAEYFGN